MCIVIDTNVIRAVFVKTDSKHPTFSSVHKWIFFGPGKIVTGGSTYWKEIKKIREIIPAILELKRKNRVISFDDAVVDAFEAEAKKIEKNKDFNDPHLVAIFRASRCLLFCSEDQAAGKYIQQKRFYPNDQDKPKIYKNKSHRKLLHMRNVAPCCQ